MSLPLFDSFDEDPAAAPPRSALPLVASMLEDEAIELARASLSWWGKWFPSGQSFTWWAGWFPEPATTTTVPGSPPAGVATFALVLEQQAKLSLAWRSGLFKSYSGLERRSNLIDDPAQKFQGQALLTGTQTLAARSRLARYAAQGQPFSLGLPYEALPLAAASTGTVLTVPSTSYADWCVVGGRVVVLHRIYGATSAVIQSFTSTTITVDVAIGTPGSLGGQVMPTLAVFLDPQQAFARYPTAIERWNISARSAVAGFTSSALRASLPLVAPKTTSGALVGLTIRALAAGAAGNAITVTQTDDSPVAQGLRSENLTTGAIALKYKAGETTVAQYIALVNGSALVYIDGTSTATDVLPATTDTFTASSLSGGADAAPAEVGKGATVTEFRGWPVWTQRLDNADTITDSMQSMAQVQDLGGLPWAAGSATVPDWGRSVQLTRKLFGLDWQWFKRFLDAVRGRWRSWWLASWRADLVPLAVGVGTLTIASGEESGDFFAWWPSQQEHLQCVSSSGALTYARISAATDNGDGTITLALVDEDDVALSLSGVPSMVSWLERVRFETDDLEVGFEGVSFKFAAQARVVQQPVEAPTTDFDSYEASVELSQPREGLKIETPAATYRIATGTRDIVIDGATYTASPAGREEVQISRMDDDGAMILQLPIMHAVAMRWLAGGVPPSSTLVTLYRQHAGSIVEMAYRGLVTSVAPEGHVAKFRVSSQLATSMARRLPTVTVGRSCPLILYDANCTVDRTTATVSRFVTNINGLDVTFSGVPGAAGFLQYGDLTHTPSGEVMAITAHVGNVVTLQFPIYGMAVGDAIDLAPGCAHDIVTCDTKFSNAANFGGFAQLPTKNPFRHARLGLGVVEQT